MDAQAAVARVFQPLTVTAGVDLPPRPPARVLEYTLAVDSTSPLTVSGVSISDTVPSGVPLAGASGVYTVVGDVVTWEPGTLGPIGRLTVTLAVTIEGLPPGTVVLNDDYGVRSVDPAQQLLGVPLETTIPYYLILMPVFREWGG